MSSSFRLLRRLTSRKITLSTRSTGLMKHKSVINIIQAYRRMACVWETDRIRDERQSEVSQWRVFIYPRSLTQQGRELGGSGSQTIAVRELLSVLIPCTHIHTQTRVHFTSFHFLKTRCSSPTRSQGIRTPRATRPKNKPQSGKDEYKRHGRRRRRFVGGCETDKSQKPQKEACG